MGTLHKLKGLGGGYGYPMLTELATLMEGQFAAGELSDIDRRMDQLNVMCRRIIKGATP